MAAARKPHEKERDRGIVAEYYIKGYSLRYIAQIIAQKVGNGYSVNHNTVSNDINALLKEWRETRVQDIDSLKVLELEKLDKLERTYWEAWEKSIEDYKKKTVKAKGKASDGAKPDYKEMTETEMIAYGNPSYLQGIERCIDKRCKILGIDAPLKHEHGGKEGGPIQVYYLPDGTKLEF